MSVWEESFNWALVGDETEEQHKGRRKGQLQVVDSVNSLEW
jgi:hypothetical protein